MDIPFPLAAPAHQPGLPHYRLLSTVFAIDGPRELLREWITPFVAHLRTDAPGGDARADLLISIEAAGAAWRMLLNGAPQGERLPAERLLPLLFGRLRTFAYQSRPYLLAIHGAVVTGAGCTLVLAGRSGSGKSTLTAALLTLSYRLVSDEPAVVDLSGDQVLPIPLGPALKAGSWPVVLPDHPELDRLPIHLRFDGQPIRYLLPECIRPTAAYESCRATHLIFPRFCPQSPPGIEPLGPVQRLRAIAEAGYQVPGLDEERVERVLGWLGSLESCALTYRSTGEAIELLEKMLNGGCHTP